MMKKYLILLLVVCNHFADAQQSTVLKDLAVPGSPAFIITDATPSQIQNPNTPKSFVLGIAESFQQSSGGFPQNYSAEFVPYWWFNAKQRDIFNVAGLRTKRINNTVTGVEDGENPFAGLKFTSLSLAFLSKDLIPDTFKVNQKIFSIGIRTTLLKYHLKGYANSLRIKFQQWHDETQNEMDILLITELARTGDASPAKKKAIYDSLIAKYNAPSKTQELVKEIKNVIEEKPIFSWDFAAAYSTYGVEDSYWTTGRAGIWTTLSSYIPLALSDEKPNKNYLNINLVARYLHDNFYLAENNAIAVNNSFDFGGKLAIEFEKLNIGVESIYRFNNGQANSQNRTVGILNYKIAENIFLNGSFGKNFTSPNKLVAIFGINWGIGTETVSMPKIQ